MWGLDYFNSKDWEIVDSKLKEIEDRGYVYCPGRDNLFAALDAVAFDDVKVMIVGQDPYPDPQHATGLAFSIPAHIDRRVQKYPPTLKNILSEYESDLHYLEPETGCLLKWCDEGVLLWNSTPSCSAWLSKSNDWPEWDGLTREIVEKLSKKGIVFCFLGVRARQFAQFVDNDESYSLEFGHPSPLNKSKPFRGCRMFTTINEKLVDLCLKPIDWRL